MAHHSKDLKVTSLSKSEDISHFVIPSPHEDLELKEGMGRTRLFIVGREGEGGHGV